MSREQTPVASGHPARRHGSVFGTSLVYLLLVGAVAVGALVAYRPSWALGVAILAPLALVCFRWTGTVAVLMLLWGAVKYGLFQVLPPLSGPLAQLEVVLILLVFVFSVLRLSRREVTTPRRFGAYWLFFAFVAVSAISWAFNSGALLALAAGVRSLATMPILALVVVLSATERDLDMFALGGVAITFLQIPIAWVQYATGGAATDVDLVNGTLGMGGANLLGIWMLAAFSACFYLFVRRGGVRWLLASAAFASVIVMAGARMSIISAPLVLIVIGLVALSRPHVRAAGGRLVMSLVVLGLVAALGLSYVYAEYARSGQVLGTAIQDLTPSSLLQRQTQIGDYSVPRLEYITYGWNFLERQSRVPLLGTGPATAGSGAAAAVSPDYQSTPFAVGLRLRSQGLATYFSAANVVTLTSQFVSTLVEYGPIGLLLLLSFYLIVGVQGLRALWRLKEPSMLLEGVSAALPVFVVFGTVGTVYGVTWEGLNIVALGIWWCVILSGALGGARAAVQKAE